MIPNYQFQLEIENGWIRRAKSEVWIGVDIKPRSLVRTVMASGMAYGS
jgi:hypothetical protein